ncbi:nucleotide sugar dehydrogenase [Thiorhodovibrio frisius]|uniref:Nucleotide sugar dehydrogenase n=1 Tax=Thiorhodovibrio frisius TaxID=631362 RepID=H8Z0C0_9GAMM|nr:nucleotide sugar dehydrogenase [Thiorhodovibrio frisius]EIC22328.1 nucleotide sugar dehydrogenase [Thiorhodovibrio frisius]WPL24625.1 UDP-N-acetyl-D-glucosamine 6-dehydrogenase [Thiorhodovibrio frisius]
MTALYELAVVGIGRVGLPLALLFASRGLRVLGIDRDLGIIEGARAGKMPFMETGCQELLASGLEFFTTDSVADAADAAAVIITVGTPFVEHFEMNLGHLNAVLKVLIPRLREGQLVILRSTVVVGTTEFVQRRIEVERGWQVGREFFLAYAPERILEGRALEEMSRLPQPIGAMDDGSWERADRLFKQLTHETFRVTFRGAELVKLFCNTSRYVYFALVNYFFMVARQFDEDIHELLDVTNRDYPRPILYSPGFSAGPCLRKDFAMISELFPQTDLFTAAWRINESMPKVIVDELHERADLRRSRVAVLGFTFKADSDDIRDSLIPKLLRYLLREVPLSVRVAEPNLPLGRGLDVGDEQFENLSVEAALRDADVVVIANMHSVFRRDWPELVVGLRPGVLIADVWNMTGRKRMFYRHEPDREIEGAAGSEPNCEPNGHQDREDA